VGFDASVLTLDVGLRCCGADRGARPVLDTGSFPLAGWIRFCLPAACLPAHFLPLSFSTCLHACSLHGAHFLYLHAYLPSLHLPDFFTAYYHLPPQLHSACLLPSCHLPAPACLPAFTTCCVARFHDVLQLRYPCADC
jgi:hypothetical protein